MNLYIKHVLPLLLLLTFCLYTSVQTPVYLSASKPIKERVEDALRRMTLEEKITLCHAQSKFSSAGVPRLGIPENWMTDGPYGIRPEVLWDEWDQAGWTNDSRMAFPALTCLAATWNPEMSALYGKPIGEEARYHNENVLSGPNVNIYRTPLNGRNFEYMGEDPYLSKPFLKQLQSGEIPTEIVDDKAHNILRLTFRTTMNSKRPWRFIRYTGTRRSHLPDRTEMDYIIAEQK
jgi:beta-glucosidase